MSDARSRLMVCYVPGLDRRRLTPDTTPFVCDALDRFPSCAIRTYPTTELVPTLVTGTMPQDHGIWQVSLRERVPETLGTRLLSLVPDGVTVLAQCVRHLFDRSFDLAAIPWRRRRHFRLHRFKYTRREGGRFDLGAGVPTVFDVLGDRSRYRFCIRSEDVPDLVAEPPVDGIDLDFLEFYAFDLTSHWNLDRPQTMARASRAVDDLVRGLAERSRRHGIGLLLLVDHGQEAVVRHVDIAAVLEGTGVPPGEYHRFVEVGVARLWFETERARDRIRRAVASVDGVRAYDNDGLRSFGIDFPDRRFGDLYLVADHGTAFFPHDFYHPLANRFLAWTHPAQRPRAADPRHRANHGQHPDHPAEHGFMVLLDDALHCPRPEVLAVDVAPTLLELVGADPPDTMRGVPAFAAPAASRVPS